MITDVPTYEDLIETADGWLNLAWEQVIETASDRAEMEDYIVEAEIRPPPGALEKVWNARRHKLNNALLLCQQAMELYLKAQIAKVSPYLLIVGEPRSWPSPSAGETVSFLDFRTLDASQLCRAARVVVGKTLVPEYETYFEARKNAKQDCPFHAGNFPTETSTRLRDCLEVFRLNHPGDRWQSFRLAYIVKSGRHGPLSEFDYDYTHTIFLRA